MARNIGILIEIMFVFYAVTKIMQLYSCLYEILIMHYWIDLIVWIALQLFYHLIGGYTIGVLFRNIKEKLK